MNGARIVCVYSPPDRHSNSAADGKKPKYGRLLTTLGEGAFFGERALIGDEPRSSTVTAVGTVECFIIDRENFTKHLGPLEDMMAVRR
jgi:CRP-like cAMP-binding protein